MWALSLLANSSVININAWIKQHILWCTPQDEDLIRAACALIRNRELLTRALCVAKILAELTLDTHLLIAGLVYESFFNADISNLTIKKILGVEVNKLVLGVQKIDLMFKLNSAGDNKNESCEVNLQNLSKLLSISNENTRIALIKLAVQVCIMRASINADEKIRVQLAHQAREIFAPLTKRLNLGQLNWELEDLAFKFLQPDIYKKIAKSLDERRVEREKYILEIKQQLEARLKLNDIDGKVFGRAKHIYSIWKKMQRKMVDYNAIHDVHALRIIVPNVMACYAALSVTHTLWRHIPQELNDYISNPKSNGYESLHTTVVDTEGKILEVQIRTTQMHQQAELGVAAHWRYKDGGVYNNDSYYGQ